MRAQVVIGAMFGDEGKGLITDWLASNMPDKPIVIRFNGGGQAGHTVVCPDGRRHVFSHIGSGSFCGAPTYLSEDFIVCPIIFCKEHREFISHFTKLPPIFVNENAKVTLPFDKMLNRRHHLNYGHGTCGEGIHETMIRHEIFPITVKDLMTWTANDIKEKVFSIYEHYYKQYYQQRTTHLEKEIQNIIEKWYSEVNYFLQHVSTAYLENLSFKNYIFEGAQGLGLDQHHEFFPHVTHSKTGLDNVLKILTKCTHVEGIDVYYISRTYATRHGNGPFPSEVKNMQFTDNTNLPSEWQGKLRFGNLDIDLLKKNITNDLSRTCGHMYIRPHIILTHADQLSERINIHLDENIMKNLSLSEVKKIIQSRIRIEVSQIFNGPTRNDFMYLKDK
jgi:adenylosuccinate synthase